MIDPNTMNVSQTEVHIVSQEISDYTCSLVAYLRQYLCSCQQHQFSQLKTTQFSWQNDHVFIAFQTSRNPWDVSEFISMLHHARIQQQSAVLWVLSGQFEAKLLPPLPLEFPSLLIKSPLTKKLIYLYVQRLQEVLKSWHFQPDARPLNCEFHVAQGLQAALHHELRNALTPVHMGTQILQASLKTAPDPVKRTMDAMADSSLSIKNTLENLNRLMKKKD